MAKYDNSVNMLTKYQLTFFCDVIEVQAGQVSRTPIKCGLQNNERAEEKVQHSCTNVSHFMSW